MDKNHRILIFFDTLILGATLVTWAFWAFSHQIGLVSGLVVLGSLIFARWTVIGSAIPLTDGGNKIVKDITDKVAYVVKAESQRMRGDDIEKFASQGLWFTSQILVVKTKLQLSTGETQTFHNSDWRYSRLSAIIMMQSEVLPKPIIGTLILGDKGIDGLYLSDVSQDFSGQIEFYGDGKGLKSVAFPGGSAPIEFELRVVIEQNDLDFFKTLTLDPKNYKKVFIEGMLGPKKGNPDDHEHLLYSLDNISFEVIDTDSLIKTYNW